MADDPKIVPSSPPVEPVDVRVSPSPAPSKPFDVPTYPSPAPAEPFDVKVYPDPPPGGTVDVKTFPDPGPGGTFDVPTSPDGPPVEPFDVPLLPDGPPGKPFDVPLLPDVPSLTPFDVPLTPDSAPGATFDVPTLPDGPPIDPVDVPTTPDGPPAVVVDPALIPFDPGVPPLPDPVIVPGNPPPVIDNSDPGVPPLPDPVIVNSGNPSVPPPVIDNSDPGVPPLPYPLSARPTTRQIVAAIKDLDPILANFLSRLDDVDRPYTNGLGGALDPSILAAWFRDYLNTVGGTGVAKFIAEQGILYAMNPVTARVFNPGYFIAMMVPGSMGHVHTTIDTQAGLTADSVAIARDVLLLANARLPDLDQGPGPNVYDSRRGHTFNDRQDFNVDEMIDAAIAKKPHRFTKPEKFQTGLLPVQIFDATKYFDDRDKFGKHSANSVAKSLPVSILSSHAALAVSNFLDGVIRVPISTYESPDGAVYSTTDNPGELVDDDDTRVPLCFTDLRKDPVKNAFRSVYFRPLNLTLSKATSPEWTEGQAFGRVDPIVAYQKTTRTFQVAFELHAFAPEDLQIMYYKMNWLDSMCYPSYGSDSLIQSGPVIRMRVGDAVSTESGGLSGILKGVSYDFAEALWELKKGMKVPRSFKVSVDFLALHEGPVGILNGAFGVFQLPPNGNQNNVDTSQGGSSESREGAPRIASILPGRFSKFGEPQR